jgi:anaerobic dimethyl sulfoxide reductase subunit C (anchor subunit)
MNVREWALPFYTILIQMSVGMLLVLWTLRLFGSKKFDKEVIDQVVRDPLLILLTTIVIGMIGAHFHLSRPYLSFLAVSNFRTSWLSREIVFTMLFFLCSAVLWFFQWYRKGHWVLKTVLGWLAILFGVVTVYCMGSIYLLPTQAAWNMPETILAFYGSMLLLGVLALAAILIMDLRFMEVRQKGGLTEWMLIVKKAVKQLTVAAGVFLIPVLIVNLFYLYSLRTGTGLAQTSYVLLLELYKPLLIIRFLLLVAGVSWLIVSVAIMERSSKRVQDLFTPAYLACLMVLVGEILGRFLFYADHIRMGL